MSQQLSTRLPQPRAQVVLPLRQKPRSTSPGSSAGPVENRLLDILEHIPRYSFQGAARLAADAGVSHSAISRLINGKSSPSFWLASALAAALE
jgi:hypothetical protein